MSNDEQAIRTLVADWFSASKAGDSAKVLSLMADDVIFMVPGQEPFGKEAFARMSDAMKGVQMEGSAEIRELEIFGDSAYIRNYIEIAITPPGASERTHRAGYTLGILRKQPDGRWLLARDANLVAEVKQTDPDSASDGKK